MIRAKKLSLISARRTLRALYAQSQGYPYAAQLPTPTATATDFNYTNPAVNQTTLAAFGETSGVAQIFPGAVLSLTGVNPEEVDLATADDYDAAGIAAVPFGLSANFVGGDLDELADLQEVGVWRGSGSVWIVLAPAFDPAADIDIGSRVGSSTVTGGTAIGVIGLSDASPTIGGVTSGPGVGVCLNPLGTNAIIIDLQVPGPNYGPTVTV